MTFDTAFGAVIRACAEPRPGRPQSDLDQAGHHRGLHEALHDAGYAHSVEVWDRAGNLAGGLTAWQSAASFVTESQFARQADASKVGLVALSAHLQQWGFC